ncbi:uncharacterized protein DS421_10g314130 [Arachis hypogaea]|nr:uncharacterized protein DS421_10g314130 [Arachis hypogaea]
MLDPQSCVHRRTTSQPFLCQWVLRMKDGKPTATSFWWFEVTLSKNQKGQGKVNHLGTGIIVQDFKTYKRVAAESVVVNGSVIHRYNYRCNDV